MSEADETRLNSGEEVFLHVYDLSAGLGAALSPFLLGKQVGGIWHTGICVYGKEFYFGNGINIDEAGMTPCGVPQQILSLGKTFVPEELVNDLLLELSATFTPESYSLLHHNCNNFSNEFCMFLLGKGIPEHILKLPQEVLNSPFGQMLQPILNSIEGQLGSMGSGNFSSEYRGTRGTHQNQNSCNKEGGVGPSAAPNSSGKEEESKPTLKQEFEDLVKQQFKKLMDDGLHTAQEAAILAISLVRDHLEGKNSCK